MEKEEVTKWTKVTRMEDTLTKTIHNKGVIENFLKSNQYLNNEFQYSCYRNTTI